MYNTPQKQEISWWHGIAKIYFKDGYENSGGIEYDELVSKLCLILNIAECSEEFCIFHLMGIAYKLNCGDKIVPLILLSKKYNNIVAICNTIYLEYIADDMPCEHAIRYE